MSSTYSEAVRCLSNQEMLSDINDASQKLAKSTVKMVHEFDTIAAHLHTIDMQGWTSPMLPQWTMLRQNHRELIWQLRTNAQLLSSRLSMFRGHVLPAMLRSHNSGSTHALHEKTQVLQNFIGVSTEHAAMTRSLTENVMGLNTNLNAFHGNFAKFTASRMTSGQSELREVAQKVGELDAQVKQLYHCVGRLVGAEATFLVFATSRTIMSSGRSGKTKMSRHRTTLTGTETTAASRVYEQIDRVRSELTHADYASQIQHRKTDTVSTSRASLTTLVSDQMIATQAILGLSLAIWARLQTDCMEITGWLQGASGPEPPAALSAYNDGGHTIYAPLIALLNTFVAGIDPSLFGQSR